MLKASVRFGSLILLSKKHSRLCLGDHNAQNISSSLPILSSKLGFWTLYMQIALVSEMITCAFPVAQAVLVFGLQHSLWLSPMPGSRCGSNLLPVSGLEAPRCWVQFYHLPAPVRGVPPQNGAGSREMHCSRNKRESPHVKHLADGLMDVAQRKRLASSLLCLKCGCSPPLSHLSEDFPKSTLTGKRGGMGQGKGEFAGMCWDP